MPRTKIVSQQQVDTAIWGSDFNHVRFQPEIVVDIANKTINVPAFDMFIDGEVIKVDATQLYFGATQIGAGVAVIWNKRIRSLDTEDFSPIYSEITNYTIFVALNDGTSTARVYYRMPDKPVSSRNIDFKTFTSLPDMPIARRATNMGYGLTAAVSRIGNVVTLNMNSTTSSSLPQVDQQRLGETMPAGYRPTSKIGDGNIVGVVVVGPGQRAGWTVEPSGRMSLSCTGATSGAIRVYATGSWITEDSWPATVATLSSESVV